MNNIVYFNEKFVKAEEAVVPINTHALHYGTGCFEGLRAYYNEKKDALYVFRMQEHFERLHKSGHILFITIPHSPKELCDITIDLLKKNFAKEDIYIRPFAFKSEKGVGKFNLPTLPNSFAIYTVPMGRYLPVEAGIKARVSSWRRISDTAVPPRAKITGSYINTALAKTEALQDGYDEALLMDDNGHIVEGSAENIFAVKNGKLITPPLSDDILEGITRNTVIQLAQEVLNIETIERSIDRSEVYIMDEIFLVGTGAEISPVSEIDKRKIGNGKVGPITEKIKHLYHQIVHGEYPKYREWLTEIKK